MTKFKVGDRVESIHLDLKKPVRIERIVEGIQGHTVLIYAYWDQSGFLTWVDESIVSHHQNGLETMLRIAFEEST